MIINSDITFDYELLTAQVHENMVIIPIKTTPNYRLDIITLKKAIELGLGEVKECEQSTVNTLIVKNDAITPLILIDGEEVIGGDQNRLVNSTILVAPKSQMKIPVSCTERGRWAYKSEFKNSEYIANYETRRAKMNASRLNRPVQNTVWSSIDSLETVNEFCSPTSAMSESYDNLKIDHNEFIKAFSIEDNQNGVVIIINGEIKGFELFLNSEIYKEFHEKILKSYLIDAKNENTTFSINIDEVKLVLDKAIASNFEKKKSEGLEEVYEFENESGFGKLYSYDQEIIHWSYFKQIEENSFNESEEDVELVPDV
ncbi:ARPP-1 family domain-containing protein [Methanobrevibacter sp.]|uniref:ARPP-1 family domain-containing protein n=1 Tax=Methanobrevibacter sp. TaxID=66852 RepID=UPI00388D6E8E